MSDAMPVEGLMERLERIAGLTEGAAEGPWSIQPGGYGCAVSDVHGNAHADCTFIMSRGQAQCKANAAYIAAANPKELLAIRDGVRELERAAKEVSVTCRYEPKSPAEVVRQRDALAALRAALAKVSGA